MKKVKRIGWREALRLQVYIAAMASTALLFNNCGIARAPQGATPSSASSTSFDHAGVAGVCTNCHGTGAPFQAFPASGHIAINGADCGTCHTPASWLSQGGLTSPHTAGAAIPTSCASCHASDLPANTVPNTADGFNHLTKYGTECVACHSVVAANVGVRWTKGYFGHLGNSPANLGTCSPCHDSKRHHAGVLCTNCHRPTYPSSSPTGNYGGRWDSP